MHIASHATRTVGQFAASGVRHCLDFRLLCPPAEHLAGLKLATPLLYTVAEEVDVRTEEVVDVKTG